MHKLVFETFNNSLAFWNLEAYKSLTLKKKFYLTFFKYFCRRASVAMQHLSSFHTMKKRGFVPCSLFLDQLLHFSGKFMEISSRRWHLQREKLSEYYFKKVSWELSYFAFDLFQVSNCFFPRLLEHIWKNLLHSFGIMEITLLIKCFRDFTYSENVPTFDCFQIDWPITKKGS